MPLQILRQQTVGGLHLLHLGLVKVGLLSFPVQFQSVQIQQQLQHLDAEVRQLDLFRYGVEFLEDVVYRGRSMDHLGMASGAKFLLEPPKIHRELPYPLRQGSGRLGQDKPDGNAVIMGKRKGEMAPVLQPAV